MELEIKKQFLANGFAIEDGFFTKEEIAGWTNVLDGIHSFKENFRRTTDLFAIRQCLKELPELRSLIFTDAFRDFLATHFGADYFLVKSIYFDKPGASNWFVAYHQDLTISVNRKEDLTGFGPWTVKQDQFGVQPPLEMLKNNFTIRIHFDHTNEANGALRVVPKSHQKGIYRPETIDWTQEREVVCNVQAGGIMIMHPLLLHASGRTINGQRRRVLHLEFSNQHLPNPLRWSEQWLVH